MSRALVAGLMSGTSLDGVDAVLLDPDPKPRVLAHAHQAFDAALRLEPQLGSAAAGAGTAQTLSGPVGLEPTTGGLK